MDAKLIELLVQGGLAGIIALIAGKVIIKLYNNMRDDHQKQIEAYKEQLKVSQEREDKLMAHQDKSNETYIKISQTLDNMCTRITQIENGMLKKE